MKDWNDKNVEARQIKTAGEARPERESERSAEPMSHEQFEHIWRADAPIGIFDSGAGGLTVLTDLYAELPHEHFIYIGDTANCPYGVRSDEEITALTLECCRFLLAREVKLIIIACNSYNISMIKITDSYSL